MAMSTTVPDARCGYGHPLHPDMSAIESELANTCGVEILISVHPFSCSRHDRVPLPGAFYYASYSSCSIILSSSCLLEIPSFL